MLKIITGILFAAALVLALPIGIYRHARYNSERSLTFTVTMLPDRSVQYNANGDKNTYANLVYTDKGTLENVDSTFPYKQNSSDLYGQLHKGGTYTCDIAGWRYGLFNMYPDIIRCSEAKA